MPSTLDQLIADANAALANVSSAAAKQQADDAGRILAAQQAARAVQDKLDTTNAVLAVANATIASLKAQLAKVTHIDPPVITVSGAVDLTPIFAKVSGNPGMVTDVKAMRDQGAGPFTLQAGVVSLAGCDGARFLGDPDNPIPISLVPGPNDAKGNPTGGSGIHVQSSDVEIGGFLPGGKFLFARMGTALRASVALRWHLHHLFSPPTPIDPKAVPGLTALIVVEEGSENGLAEWIGSDAQPMATLGAGVFNMATGTMIRNWWGCSWNEQSGRTVRATATSAVPVNLECTNINAWSVTSKECWTWRTGRGVFNGGHFHGNLRFGEESGSDNVTVSLGGNGVCSYCETNPDGPFNSSLDLQSGTALAAADWIFDHTAALEAVVNGQRMSRQQAMSGSASSTATIGANVVVWVQQGVTAKSLVSGAKRLGQMATAVVVPPHLAAHAQAPAKAPGK